MQIWPNANRGQRSEEKEKSMNQVTPLQQNDLAEVQAASNERDANAEKIIWANVLVNAGLGVAPFGINVFTFIGFNVAMIIAVGHIYGYTMNREQAGGLIQRILLSAGMTWSLGALGVKFLEEIIKIAGITTFGAATAVAMAVDGVLLGGVSYALGFTAMTYFKADCRLDKKVMRKTFRHTFDAGKAKIAETATNNGASFVSIECPHCHVSRSESFPHVLIDSGWFQSNYKCANKECGKTFGSASSITSPLKIASAAISVVAGSISLYKTLASGNDDESA
jgi:uncharacterized protein (DUF697 family)